MLGLLLCCGPSDYFWGPPPDLPQDGALVFALREPAGLRVIAVAPQTRPLLSIELPSQDDFEIVVLVYAEPLQDLGLSAGPVPLAALGTCGARALPPPKSQYNLRPGEPGWQPLGALPSDVERLRIQGPCPCADFEIVARIPLEFEPQGPVVDAGSLLYFGGGPIVTRMQADGRREVIPLDTYPPGPTDTFRADDGTLWVTTEHALWSGRVPDGFTQTASLALGGILRDLSGGEGPAGFEVFAASDIGEIVKLNPGAPKVLSTRAAGPSGAQQRSRLVWLGPGSVVASEEGTLDLVFLQEGRSTRRTSFPAESRGTRVIESIDGLGVVVYTVLSSAYLIEGNDLSPILGTPELATPNDLTAFDRGYVYVGDSGYIQQYVPDHGYCETKYLGDKPRFTRIFNLGDALMAFGPTVDGIQAYVIEVTRS